MNRSQITLREAEPADAPFLAELWIDGLRRADPAEQLADVEQIVKTAAVSPEQRLVVAEFDGERAGAVLLRISTVSPVNPDLVVQAVSPHVVPSMRRRGVGRSLLDCAVGFAEEAGVPHVATAVVSGSRDANRFMARLALGPLATVRVAPTAAVRARLTAQQPRMRPEGTRARARVLAARRSQRRAKTAAPEQG